MAQNNYDLSDLGGKRYQGKTSLEDLGGTFVSQQSVPRENQIDSSTNAALGKIVQSPEIQGILGFGDEAARVLSAGILHPKFGQGLGYQLGGIEGDIFSMFAPGRIAEGIAAGVPELSSIYDFLTAEGKTGAARRALGSAAFGAAATPEDRKKGALMGGMAGAIGEIAGAGTSKLLSKIRPAQFAKVIINKVRSKLGSIEKISKGRYDEVFRDLDTNGSIYPEKIDFRKEGLGNEQVYLPNQEIPPEEKSQLSYTDISPKDIKNVFNAKTKRVHNLFIENPTAKNAHDLKSSIDHQIRQIEKASFREGSLSTPEWKMVDSLDFARSLLHDDLDHYFDTKAPELKDAYNGAQRYFAMNVIPHRITLNELSKLGENPTPENVSRVLDKLKRQEFATKMKKVPDYIHGDLDLLNSRIAARNIAQRVGGVLGGYGLSRAIGLPVVEQLLTAAGGGFVGRGLGQQISSRLPRIGAGGRNYYQPIMRATIASLLGGMGR